MTLYFIYIFFKNILDMKSINFKLKNNCSGNLTPRIVWGIIIEVIVFMITVALAMINSADWPDMFFWITLGSVFILNSKYYFIINRRNKTKYQMLK